MNLYALSFKIQKGKSDKKYKDKLPKFLNTTEDFNVPLLDIYR